MAGKNESISQIGNHLEGCEVASISTQEDMASGLDDPRTVYLLVLPRIAAKFGRCSIATGSASLHGDVVCSAAASSAYNVALGTTHLAMGSCPFSHHSPSLKAHSRSVTGFPACLQSLMWNLASWAEG